MTSTIVPEPAFLQELRYFTKTLPQQYRTYQAEQLKKAKASIIEKEIQKNRKLVEPKPTSLPRDKTEADVKRES